MDENTNTNRAPTAFLVDLVSNRKIPISNNGCKAGRDELNDVVITGDQAVSRFHFVITKEGDRFYVQDNKSRHGTFLNGTKVSGVESIKDGDVLKVGVSLFWFVLDTSPGIVSPQMPPAAVAALVERDNNFVHQTTREDQSRTTNNVPIMPSESMSATPLTSTSDVTKSNKATTIKPSGGSQGFGKLLADSTLANATDHQPVDEFETVNALKKAMSEFNSKGPIPEFNASPESPIPKRKEDDQTNEPNKEVQFSTTPLERFAEVIGQVSKQNQDRPIEKPGGVAFEAFLPGEPTTVIEATEGPALESSTGATAAINPMDKLNGDGEKVAATVNVHASNTTNCTSPYFIEELQQLGGELSQLQSQIIETQKKVEQTEERIKITKGLRDTLMSTQGDKLVAACAKAFGYLGWQAKPGTEDKQELQLQSSDRPCIARIIWTNNKPERADLGDLTISLTRFWCVQGTEAKGILIVGSGSGNGPPALATADYSSELSDYAGKRGICLMTTGQLLSLFGEIILKDGNSDALKSEIISTNGWLTGHNLKECTESGDKKESRSDKLSAPLPS